MDDVTETTIVATVETTHGSQPLKGTSERAIVLHTLQERMAVAKKVAKRGRFGAVICGALGLILLLLFAVSGFLEMRADPDWMYIVLAGVLISAPFIAVAIVM